MLKLLFLLAIAVTAAAYQCTVIGEIDNFSPGQVVTFSCLALAGEELVPLYPEPMIHDPNGDNFYGNLFNSGNSVRPQLLRQQQCSLVFVVSLFSYAKHNKWRVDRKSEPQRIPFLVDEEGRGVGKRIKSKMRTGHRVLPFCDLGSEQERKCWAL